ncbi:Exopolyphosphatase [Entophlyctis luteolus]|nr:Exopolyphosphatase [Entophlyctis luteolus]
MTHHCGRIAVPESVNQWWDRQRGLVIQTAEFSPLGTAGTYGDLEKFDGKRDAAEWDDLPVDSRTTNETFTFNIYDEESTMCYQFHSKCAGLLIRKLESEGLTIAQLVDWLKIVCPVTEDLVQSIPDMPDPFEISERQGQSFVLDFGSIWLLASFDGPIEFSPPDRVLSGEDISLCKSNIATDLEFEEDISELALLGDITALDVDAIVNSTSETLKGTGAAEKAIHAAAGPQLEIACKNIGYCRMGGAVATDAFNLKCKRLIHTVVSPRKNPWDLRDCYMSCLKLAVAEGLHSIAFPCVGVGKLGFPVKDSALIAIDAVVEFLETCTVDLEVCFCVYSYSDMKVYNAHLDSIFPPGAADSQDSSSGKNQERSCKSDGLGGNVHMVGAGSLEATVPGGGIRVRSGAGGGDAGAHGHQLAVHALLLRDAQPAARGCVRGLDRGCGGRVAFFLRRGRGLVRDAAWRAGGRVVLVAGNEACDVDSLACAVAAAWTLAHTFPALSFVPLVPIPRAQLALRGDCTAAISAAFAHRDADDFVNCLTFLDSLPPPANDPSQLPAKIVLVDHNVPASSLRSRLGTLDVVGIIDHHADEGMFEKCALVRMIEPVGSATSIAVNMIKSSDPPIAVDASFAKLLVAPILLDTVHLDPSSNRVTSADVRASEFLQGIIRNEDVSYSSLDHFKLLQSAKFDVRALNVEQILGRDYKQTTCVAASNSSVTLGISSVSLSLSSLLAKEKGDVGNFLGIVRNFANERKLDIYAIMTAFEDETTGVFSRELLVSVSGKEELFPSSKLFEKLENIIDLDLKGVTSDNLQCSPDHVRVYKLGNIKMSRKLFQPILVPIIQSLL